MVRQRLATSVIILLAWGCSKDKDNGGDNGAGGGGGGAGPVGSLKLNMAIVNAGTDGASLRLTTDPDYRFEHSSIVSGPPSEMELFIKSIQLGSTDNSVMPVNIFSDTAGKPVRIQGSKIDLSSIFTTFECLTENGDPVVVEEGETCECGVDENGSLIGKIEQDVMDEEGNATGEKEMVCDLDSQVAPPTPVVPAAVATYNQLNVTYRLGARMKGCATGYFGAFNRFTPAQEVTYCTKDEGSYFATDVEKTESFFQGTSVDDAEWTMVPIGRGGAQHQGAVDADIFASYSIGGGGITLAPGESSDLTFVIDVNRMLRFQNAGREDDPALSGTSWTKDRAYFFNSVFLDSVFMFAGKPGSIRGYQFNVRACNDGDEGIDRNDDYSCDIKTDDDRPLWHNLQGWMTLIFDPEGQPLLMSFMPDDDNSLTVMKGTNAPEVRGDTEPGSNLNPAAFVEKADNVYDLNFGLSELAGVVYDFPMNLEKNATSSFLKYEGLTTADPLTDSEDFGLVQFQRKL